MLSRAVPPGLVFAAWRMVQRWGPPSAAYLLLAEEVLPRGSRLAFGTLGCCHGPIALGRTATLATAPQAVPSN
jgi:hypothetical protein